MKRKRAKVQDKRYGILFALLEGRRIVRRKNGSLKWDDIIRGPSLRDGIVSAMLRADWLNDTGAELTLSPTGKAIAEASFSPSGETERAK